MSLVYGDPAVRRVAVTLDVNGKPTSYSDLRGDLIVSDDHEGDFTAIMVNLLKGQALVQNRPEHGAPQAFVMRMNEAMGAADLDHPADRIAEVLATCVKKSGPR